MKINKIKTKNYSILIGKNSLSALPNEINKNCPKCKKIGIIIDKKVPKKFLIKIRKILKKYKVFVFFISSSEKIKSLKQTEIFVNKFLKLKFNRSDLLIGVGGGIVGDMVGFLSSIYKRGINFINIPSTLLAQVDSCVGGKTGVNSIFGKNLIGAFYNPKVVVSDTNLLNSLSKRELICGYAEILKHAIIFDKKFFNFLKSNTSKIFSLNSKVLSKTIKRSCEIKLNFTEKDFREKGTRMKLNFGHTFAHALEIKNKYSSKLNHGEAVLLGMFIATKISKYKKICNFNTPIEILKIFEKYSLLKSLQHHLKKDQIIKSIKFMVNDKKKDDDKISFILLKKVGKTTKPGKYKYNPNQVENFVRNLF